MIRQLGYSRDHPVGKKGVKIIPLARITRIWVT